MSKRTDNKGIGEIAPEVSKSELIGRLGVTESRVEFKVLTFEQAIKKYCPCYMRDTETGRQQLRYLWDEQHLQTLSLVAKWLAFTCPDVHKLFLDEFKNP